jgi:general stress protein 26
MSKTKTPQETLWELIKDIRFGMLTHRHPGGMLHAHPLTTLNKSIDEAGTLYFFVSKKTELGQRIQQDGQVNVSYSKPENDSYISVAGQARVSEDMATKERLFNALTKAWFPGGAADPDLELVEVQIHHAEYWDVKESKVTQLFKMAKSAITGNQPHIGEHKELHFS